MATIEVSLRLTVRERPTRFGSAEELRKALVEYVTSREAPLWEDYGPEAWGGYDGAYITRAEVVSSEVRP